MYKALFLTLFLAASVVKPRCSTPQSFPVNEPFTRLCLPSWALGRRFSISKESLIGRELVQEGAAVELGALKRHFEQIERRFQVQLNEQRTKNISSELCKMFHQEAFNALRVKMSNFGWGLVKGPSCVTEFRPNGQQLLRKSFEAYKRKLNIVKDRAVKAAGFIGWTNPSTIMEFSHLTETENCTIKHLHALRRGGEWHISASITNDDPKKILPDRKRLYLTELLLERNGLVASSNTTLPLYRHGAAFDAMNPGFVRNTRAMLSVWGGRPGVGALIAVKNPSLNPGTRAVMAKIREERSKKLSTSSSRTVKRFKAVRTWIYGIPIGNNLAGAETWISECTATI